jgi:hypothetical protein
VPGETRSCTSPTRWKTRRMAPSPGGRVRRSSRTSPMRITICSSVHPTGRAPSVTSPRRENTARRAEGPRALRERLTQSQAATAPRTITDRTTQSAGLGEKLTSEYTRGVSAGEPSKSMPPIRCSLPRPAGHSYPILKPLVGAPEGSDYSWHHPLLLLGSGPDPFIGLLKTSSTSCPQWTATRSNQAAQTVRNDIVNIRSGGEMLDLGHPRNQHGDQLDGRIDVDQVVADLPRAYPRRFDLALEPRVLVLLSAARNRATGKGVLIEPEGLPLARLGGYGSPCRSPWSPSLLTRPDA